MKFNSDIDIDLADRKQALALLKHTPASIIREDGIHPHATGIYVTDIPIDPMSGRASLDYKQAEKRNYIKLDLLNVSLYQQITSEQQLIDLMHQKPNWARLQDQEFVQQLIHINNHYDLMQKLYSPIDSIEKMAMFLAMIRPAKRHLVGKPWHEIAETVWTKSEDGSYGFKKSHSISYAHLVVLNMNLLTNRGI
jgi:hypothetical protein